MWRIYPALALVLTMQTTMGQGKLLPERSVASEILGTNRAVRIYLPPSYERDARRRYPVLYLHDGQNVFSPAGTNCCFGWGSWELDKIADELSAARRMQEVIMVAVDNSQSRYEEYRGPDAPEGGTKAKKKSAAGAEPPFEKYAGFLCKELKPQIDREFRTRPEAKHTAVLGSSLGGICSVALAWEHPKTFGAAASLSGSFQIERRNFLKKILEPSEGRRKPVRFYLDTGTIDFTGDDDGRKNTEAVAAQLRRIGWKDGVNLKHFVEEKLFDDVGLEWVGLRRDKWEEAWHSQHNEFYWRRRVWRALEFLFPPGE